MCTSHKMFGSIVLQKKSCIILLNMGERHQSTTAVLFIEHSRKKKLNRLCEPLLFNYKSYKSMCIKFYTN